jgi:hypothetical protein
MRRFVFGVVAAVAFGAACGGTGSGASGVIGVGGGTAVPLDTVNGSLGSSLSVRIGQVARIQGAGVGFRFVEVREDSRCPVGAQCIQAGNAQVSIETRTASGAVSQAILNLTANTQFQSVTTVDGIEIRFESLTPVPAVNTTISRSSYVASFRVTRP